MNKDGKFSLVIKCGCHCAYTNENSDNGNIKKQVQNLVFLSTKIITITFLFNLFLASHCYRSVEPIYKHNKHIFRLQ